MKLVSGQTLGEVITELHREQSTLEDVFVKIVGGEHSQEEDHA